MDILKTSLLILCLVLSACARSWETTISEPGAKSAAELSRAVNAIENPEQSQLLFFITDSCLSCRKEAKELANYFGEKGKPTKILFRSYFLSADQSEIDDWRESIGINIDWELKTDPDLVMYKNFFNEIITPSVVYYNAENRSVITKQGMTTLSQLQEMTAPWY